MSVPKLVLITYFHNLKRFLTRVIQKKWHIITHIFIYTCIHKLLITCSMSETTYKSIPTIHNCLTKSTHKIGIQTNSMFVHTGNCYSRNSVFQFLEFHLIQKHQIVPLPFIIYYTCTLYLFLHVCTCLLYYHDCWIKNKQNLYESTCLFWSNNCLMKLIDSQRQSLHWIIPKVWSVKPVVKAVLSMCTINCRYHYNWKKNQIEKNNV